MAYSVDKSSQKDSSTDVLVGLSEAAKQGSKDKSYLAAQFAYDSKGKREPFMSLVTPDGRILEPEIDDRRRGGLRALRLEGIVYETGNVSYAIVNGSIVKIGDKVGDYVVLDILPRKVVILKNDKREEISLPR